MRILHVIQELRTGGAERVLLALARAARERGAEVAVAASSGELESELDGKRFPLPLVARRPQRIPSAALAVRRAAGAFDPTIVHAHNPTMALATGIATVGGRHPVALVGVQGSPEEDWPAAARLLRWSRLPAVSCGPGVTAALADHGLTAIATVSNAVSPPPPPADRKALERQLGLTPGRHLVVSVGRLVEQKNQALAIRALADVPDTTLAIVGEGPLRAELEQLARTMDVAERIVFTGLRPDARALMGASDAIVLPSNWEGLPLVALEALASGRPLVATAVRGIRELLADGESAVLVPPHDPAVLASALRRVLADPALATRLARGGQIVAAAASEEAMIDGYFGVYEELLRR
jgi:glycosyltransferase involved in cell wall biosynthesis